MDNETLDYREHLEKDAPRLQETLRDTENVLRHLMPPIERRRPWAKAARARLGRPRNVETELQERRELKGERRAERRAQKRSQAVC